MKKVVEQLYLLSADLATLSDFVITSASFMSQVDVIFNLSPRLKEHTSAIVDLIKPVPPELQVVLVKQFTAEQLAEDWLSNFVDSAPRIISLFDFIFSKVGYIMIKKSRLARCETRNSC